MKAFLALIRREYLEHKGAFLHAPAALVLLLAAAVAMMALGRREVIFSGEVPSLLDFFVFGFGGFAGAWWVYTLIALFFYFSNAYSADRRNNAMLFWKSMPQTDFKVLLAKMAAGLTLFPALVFVALLISGVLVYAMMLLASGHVAGMVPPAPGTVAWTYGQMAVGALVFYVLGVLWYAPFFAWVGGLSTVVGRWSIPLAFLIPGVLMLLENMLLSNPGGGYVWQFLSGRSQFGFESWEIFGMVLNPVAFNVPGFTNMLLARIDWTMMVAGWVFAAAAIYVASEYRRRVLAA